MLQEPVGFRWVAASGSNFPEVISFATNDGPDPKFVDVLSRSLDHHEVVYLLVGLHHSALPH